MSYDGAVLAGYVDCYLWAWLVSYDGFGVSVTDEAGMDSVLGLADVCVAILGVDYDG